MPSKNRTRDSILRFLSKSKNDESTIEIISTKLDLDYNDCVVFCDDIIEKQLVDAFDISSVAQKVLKNKNLVLSPRGISFLRKGGFRKEAKLSALKTFANFAIPIAAFLISAMSLFSTLQDQKIQNERWKILNEAQMAIRETKMLAWLSYPVSDFMKIKWGYTVGYLEENNRRSTFAYLVARDRSGKQINTSRYYILDSLMHFLGAIKYKDTVSIFKVFTADFAFENFGKTNAREFSVTPFTKTHRNDNWMQLINSDSTWQTVIPQSFTDILIPIPYYLNDPVSDTIYFKILSQYKNLNEVEIKDTLFSRYTFSDNIFHNM